MVQLTFYQWNISYNLYIILLLTFISYQRVFMKLLYIFCIMYPGTKPAWSCSSICLICLLTGRGPGVQERLRDRASQDVRPTGAVAPRGLFRGEQGGTGLRQRNECGKVNRCTDKCCHIIASFMFENSTSYYTVDEIYCNYNYRCNNALCVMNSLCRNCRWSIRWMSLNLKYYVIVLFPLMSFSLTLFWGCLHYSHNCRILGFGKLKKEDKDMLVKKLGKGEPV